MSKKPESKEVTVVEVTKKKIGDPGVIAVNGVILEPVAKVSKQDTAVIHNGILLVENLGLLTLNDRSGELSIYEVYFKGKGRGESIDLFIIADDLSSLDHKVWDPRVGSVGPFAAITLINSSSTEDYFKGSSVLSNVDSGCSFYIDSVIEGSTYGVPTPERITAQGIEANLVKFRGRQLPPGTYSESTLHENTFGEGGIEPRASVFIEGSTLTHNRFGEGGIDIEKSQLHFSQFLFTGKTTITGTRLKEEYFGDIYPSIHLTSPFDLTVVEIGSQGRARMVRIDDDNVVITLPSKLPVFFNKKGTSKLLTMSFKNPERYRVIRDLAYQQFFGDAEPSETEHSVVDYLIDTIRSRVKMINLLDTARRLVEGNLLEVKDPDMKGAIGKGSKPIRASNQFNWPITNPSFINYQDPVKDDDKTIYIDGDTFK